MSSTSTEPVEPSAAWRMLCNGRTYAETAAFCCMTKAEVLKAEQLQNEALHNVDPKLIADPVFLWLGPRR